MSESLSVTEVDSWLRFQLIVKPEQSGKTFIMIKEIIGGLTEQIDGKEIINFILCDNNLLLTIQTGKRLKTNKELQKHFIGGETYVELSSHERAKCHDTQDVVSAIAVDGARNIICCTNGKRMDDINKIISKINSQTSSLKDKFHFNIWLDEADKFITFIESTLRPLVREHTNVNVKLITATADPLFKKYKYMNVFPLETTTEKDKYHGWADNDLRFYDKKDGLEFVEHILTEVAQTEIKPGTKWFIPASTKKKTHDAIKDICIAKEMAVICVNGDGIKLTFPKTRRVIPYKKVDDFNKQIIDIYIENELHNYPVVITGYICIGRGITIMSEEFMLDYAILSNCSDKCEVSQIAGRLKGNIKQFSNYKKPVVFTTEKFNDIAIEMETKSRELAILAFERGQNGMSLVIGKSEYEGVLEPWIVRHEVLYGSYEDARDFLVSMEKVMGKKVNISEDDPIHNCDGYLVTSKLLKRGKKVADLTKEDRFIDGKNDLGNGSYISKTGRGSSYLILPIYDKEDSPPESVRFQVRYYNKQIHTEHKKKEKDEKSVKIGGGGGGGGGI
jgi:hypothetical protein